MTGMKKIIAGRIIIQRFWSRLRKCGRASVPACVFSRVPPIILTAPETGSTLSWFQKHQPAGGCCDVSPFESRRGKRGEGRSRGWWFKRGWNKGSLESEGIRPYSEHMGESKRRWVATPVLQYRSRTKRGWCFQTLDPGVIYKMWCFRLFTA